MCTDCGCQIRGHQQILAKPSKAPDIFLGRPERVLQGLLQKNDQQADQNRQQFERYGVLVINLMSSPGSGKTALLEATMKALKGELRMAVIEGDLETENDAKRIRALGITAYQITTGTACHLDAHMVAQALDHLPLKDLDVLFIENVGNLVCPASFDLGHHLNVTLLSVTEGDDKPQKYPVMFRAADLLLITKTDLLPYLPEFSIARATASQRALATKAKLFPLSAKTSEGLSSWTDWMRRQRASYQALLEKGLSLKPRVAQEGKALHLERPEITFKPLTL
jgi:hydrogenase nickel incorporation protein HypB